MQSDTPERPPIPLVPPSFLSWFEQHRRTAVDLAVLVGIAVGLVGETLALWLVTPRPATDTRVIVVGIQFAFNTPDKTGYVGGINELTGCDFCPFTVNRSALFFLVVQFRNNDSTRVHTVTGAEIGEPFRQGGLVANVSIYPGITEPVEIAAIAPQEPGSYVLTGILIVT